MRSITRALTLGLLLATAAPAWAQGWYYSSDFDRRLGEMQGDRLRAYRETRPQLIDGWCERRLSNLDSLHDLVERSQAQISPGDLARYRQALAQERAYPCPPGGPPTPPAPPFLPPPFERTDAYRQWEPVSSQIAGDLYEAERAGLAGNCDRRANRLRDAARRINDLTAEISRQGAAFGERFGGAGLDLYRRRLEAELARPCPPGAPPPTPPVQVATPPMTGTTCPPTPAQGISQQDADEVARQQRLFDSMERERREAAAARTAEEQRQFDEFSERQREREQAANRRRCQVHRRVFDIAVGYGESEIPRTNYGFVRDGPVGTADERAAGFSRVRVPMLFIEGSAQFRGIGRFNLGYAEGDARNRADVASSTTGGAQGVVGTGLSPAGNTGVTGNLGVSVVSEVSFREYYGGYRYIFGDEDDAAALNQGRVALSGSAGVTVNYRDRDHLGVVSITRTTAPPISVVQTLDQRVNEFQLAAVAGGRAIIPLGTSARFILSAEIGAYFYDHDGSSTESRDQNIGLPADQRYDLGLPLHASGLGWSGDFDIRADFPLHLETIYNEESYVSRMGIGGQFDIFIEFSVSIRSDVAQILNPRNGDQVLGGATTRLGTTDAVGVKGAGGFTYYFN